MPIACSQTVLTGQDGAAYLKPAGTEVCLADLSDFPAGPGVVTVPVTHDFRPGDPVVLRREGGNLDSNLTAGTTYYIGLTTTTTVQLLATKGGSPVTLAGDGGQAASNKGTLLTLGTVAGGSGYQEGSYLDVPFSGGSGTGATGDFTVNASGVVTTVTINDAGINGYMVGDILTVQNQYLGGTGAGFQVPVATITALPTDTPGGHINMSYAEYEAICQVAGFTLNLTRDQLDTTSLPCGVGQSQGKYAPFRTRQPSYIDGTGTMTIRFTRDQTSMAARVLSNAFLRTQEGSRVKLYVDAVSDGNASNPQPDDVTSSYIEGPISIEGLDTNVNPDNPTEATLNFSFSGTPTRLFTIDL